MKDEHLPNTVTKDQPSVRVERRDTPAELKASVDVVDKKVPTGHATPVLVSHALCPYVQRVAIVLTEKGIDFERIDIDLANKPAWFLQLSPLGKTPVLKVGHQAIFESSVICEYLDDCFDPPLHPTHPLLRATHRAWMVFGSELLNLIGGFYSAQDRASLHAKALTIRERLVQLEAVLHEGPYFAGEFGMVDAVFGPAFRYFAVFDKIADFGFWQDLPKVQQWRQQLAARPSIQQAVSPNYHRLLHQFIRNRPGALSTMLEACASA